MKYLLLFATSLLVAYSQIVLKWQINALSGAGQVSEAKSALAYVIRLMQNPWVWTSVAATFLAGIAWMLALSKFDLGAAYPAVLGLTFILVLMASVLFLQEGLSTYRIAGIACTILGIVFLVR